MQRILLIIPAYNEAGNIEHVVRNITSLGRALKIK